MLGAGAPLGLGIDKPNVRLRTVENFAEENSAGVARSVAGQARYRESGRLARSGKLSDVSKVCPKDRVKRRVRTRSPVMSPPLRVDSG